MLIPPWVPITVSLLGVLGSFTALFVQVRRSRFVQSVDLLFKLEADFFGGAKKAQRVKAAHDLLEGRVLEAEPILDFFETMALLHRRKALDGEMVAHTFFYWIDRYFEAAREAIRTRQQIDPLVWQDLTELVMKLRADRERNGNSGAYAVPDSEEVRRFLNEELTEAA